MGDLLQTLVRFISEHAIFRGVPLRFAIAGAVCIASIILMIKWGTVSEARIHGLRVAAVVEALHGKERPTFEAYATIIPLEDFCFFGISAKRFIVEPGVAERLVQLAKKGHSVRFIMLNPESPNLSRKAREEGEDPATWQQDIVASINRIHHLNSSNGVTIEVRLYDQLPLWRLIQLGDTLHVSYYVAGRQGIETPVLVLNRDRASEESNLYDAFDALVREVWRHSSRVSQQPVPDGEGNGSGDS